MSYSPLSTVELTTNWYIYTLLLIHVTDSPYETYYSWWTVIVEEDPLNTTARSPGAFIRQDNTKKIIEKTRNQNQKKKFISIQAQKSYFLHEIASILFS